MKRTTAGFTLIEMVVVIIIVAVMAAVVVPAYGRFYARAKFEGQVRDVQDVFAYAREQSISRDAPVTLNFQPQSESFDVTLTPPPLPTDQPTALSDAAADTSTLAVTHTVILDPSTSVVGFAATDASQGSAAGGNTTGSSASGRGATVVHFRSDGTSDGAELTVVSGENNYSAHMTLHPGTARLTVDEDAQPR